MQLSPDAKDQTAKFPREGCGVSLFEGLLERRIQRGIRVIPHGVIPGHTGLVWPAVPVPSPATRDVDGKRDRDAHSHSLSSAIVPHAIYKNFLESYSKHTETGKALFVPQFHFYAAVKNIPINRFRFHSSVERSLSFNVLRILKETRRDFSLRLVRNSKLEILILFPLMHYVLFNNEYIYIYIKHAHIYIIYLYLLRF